MDYRSQHVIVTIERITIKLASWIDGDEGAEIERSICG